MPQIAADACRGVDVVFHAAGAAGIWGPWEHYYGINTLATQNVIAGCRRHGVPKLVYTSSPSVTFDGGDQMGVDESVPYPHTLAVPLSAHESPGRAAGAGGQRPATAC